MAMNQKLVNVEYVLKSLSLFIMINSSFNVQVNLSGGQKARGMTKVLPMHLLS